jgi:ribonuclease R
MKIERTGDDIASCFALESLLYETGPDQVFEGEITGLISAGAFIAFAPLAPEHGEDRDPPFEGMLPVRVMRAPAAPGAKPPPRRPGRGHGQREAGEAREWWELNEEATILRGERTGATLRLGDAVQVRVARVDTVRGRVDLLPAG